jgi:hypothetical protein
MVKTLVFDQCSTSMSSMAHWGQLAIELPHNVLCRFGVTGKNTMKSGVIHRVDIQADRIRFIGWTPGSRHLPAKELVSIPINSGLEAPTCAKTVGGGFVITWRVQLGGQGMRLTTSSTEKEMQTLMDNRTVIVPVFTPRADRPESGPGLAHSWVR